MGRIVILAAGEGKRMRSRRPKVLHTVGGLTLLEHVLRQAEALGMGRPAVVAGSWGEELLGFLRERVELVVQDPPRGTGDALRRAAGLLPREGPVLVLYGDTPLIRAEVLKELLHRHQETGAAVSVLTVEMDTPFGYGRILRSPEGIFQGIVEERDASPAEREIREVNTGIYVFEAAVLLPALERLTPDNAQGEYYLTDAVGIIRAGGGKVESVPAPDFREVLGVNDREELARAERLLNERNLRRLFAAGVSILDPASTYVGSDVEVGRDTVLLPGTFLEGRTEIGEGCEIGPGSRIRDSRIGEGSRIELSVVEEADLAPDTRVGPFAHLRPGVRTEPGVRIGNFAELKNATIGSGTKVPHHSYLGDARIGSGVNIGAGTVIVNYDGFAKHESEIADRAFIGCNSNLVSPVRIGEGAFVAAGSTVTKDVPAGALGVERSEQRNIEGWVERRRWKMLKRSRGDGNPES